MLVIKEKANIKTEYPLENVCDISKSLFFDIETTGFSRQYCNIYLIGCMYYEDGVLMYTQWLAENFNDEKNILTDFHNFIKRFDTLIHFNGNSFDIPFIKERGEKYKLDFNFEAFKSIDLYKSVSKINHILKMENQKQKTFEIMLGYNRTDPFSGGDLIEVFKQYVESKDSRLIYPLLLHNKEDLFGMGYLSNLLVLNDIKLHSYELIQSYLSDYIDMNGDKALELIIKLKLETKLLFPIIYNYDGIYIKVNGDRIFITVAVKNGTFKYFFKNYKDYYYLLLEDEAIHKSVGSYVDSKYRQQATPSTCYTKRKGEFLPLYDISLCEQVFYQQYKDKQGYIPLSALDNINIIEYCNSLITYLFTKSK